jgi:ABC-2 type transport system permease protein
VKRQFLLLAHSLRRIRTLLLITGLLLGAFQVMLVFVARFIANSGGFEQLTALLPPFAREFMGPYLTSFMSFAGIISAGYIDLGVLAALIAMTVAIGTTPTAEIESGFIDLVLARPLPRHWIITRTILAMLVATVVLLTMMMLGTWLGLEMIAPRTVVWPSAKLILSLAANLGLLMLAWGALALAIGAASQRRSVAGAMTGLVAVTGYLVDYVGRIWKPAESVAWLSPFRYYKPFDLIMGNSIPLKHAVVLGGIVAVSCAAGYVLFARRDISH